MTAGIPINPFPLGFAFKSNFFAFVAEAVFAICWVSLGVGDKGDGGGERAGNAGISSGRLEPMSERRRVFEVGISRVGWAATGPTEPGPDGVAPTSEAGRADTHCATTERTTTLRRTIIVSPPCFPDRDV